MQNIPESLINSTEKNITVYDFKMTKDVIKSKVNLTMHMFSFLQIGNKQVHFADTSVEVNDKQSVIIKNGNCLMTELLSDGPLYFCKLLFFTDNHIETFLKKHNLKSDLKNLKSTPHFIIENDDFIKTFVISLANLYKEKNTFLKSLLIIKFEEIMIYLVGKYGDNFLSYIQSLVSDNNSSFRNVVETNVYSNLKLEEIAFLCNMSLSTFKRHFILEFDASPGKWLQHKRLVKAKEILEKGEQKSSEIYKEFGYNNLSNFSIAFKNQFGISPKDI